MVESLKFYLAYPAHILWFFGFLREFPCLLNLVNRWLCKRQELSPQVSHFQ